MKLVVNFISYLLCLAFAVSAANIVADLYVQMQERELWRIAACHMSVFWVSFCSAHCVCKKYNSQTLEGKS